MSSPKAFWDEFGQHAWQLHFENVLAALASIRAFLGLTIAAWLISTSLGEEIDLIVRTFALQIVVFTVAGLLLYKKGLVDSRARLLGVAFLLIGNAYVWTLAFISSGLEPPKAFLPIIATVAGLRPEAFLAFFFWLFAEAFPAPTANPRLRKFIIVGRTLSLVVGSWFAFMGLVRIFLYFTKINLDPALVKITQTITSIWYVLVPLVGLALLVFLFKFRQLRRPDRPRTLIFFAASFISLIIPFLGMAINSIREALFNLPPDLSKTHFYIFTIFTNLLLLTFPFIATYTILAHRVLDIETIARSTARQVLARYSVVLFGSIPFGYLIYFGWINRNSTIAELFSGGAATALVTASVVGLIAMVYRQPLLDWIDRRFFSERYNARRVLTELTEQVRGTRNLVDLSKLLERGVDLALHLERVSLLTEQPGAGRFVDPRQQVRPLDPGSQLMTLISGSREPIAVDLESPRSPFLSLPEEDKLWLVENRVEMIAPAHSLDGSLIGLLALGPKRSELPFLREDRDLLAGVASSAGLVIELLGLKETVVPVAAANGAAPAAEADAEPAPAGPDETALECIACDRIFPPGSTECPNCHVDLEKTNAPYILRDLYRLDSRLGAGGMAVVYRAKDLKLGRAVAIKTLPKVNAEAAMRLRREARTAASVSHPGLAAIYGLETWRGVPMIITELLAGGTLADQLHEDPLKPLEAIDMARTIAQALAKIHTVGILHRDVKPSNIGYTEDGEVKLLDFGIARIQHDFRQEKPDSDASTEVNGKSRIVNTASMMLPRTATGQLVGTVTYLSPEAARGEKPDPGVDLWALAVCLYESLTAENLFYGRNFQDVLNQIRDLKIPDVRKKAPGCPEPLALFLARELDLDRSRRAEDGLEMANRLSQVRAKILAA